MPRSPLLLALPLCLLACTGTEEPGPEPGRLGWPCPNDNNCIAPLRCVEGLCAEPPPIEDAGAPEDAGPVDLGQPDAGTPDAEVDAGVPDVGPDDAGCQVPPTLAAIVDQVFGADRDPHCNQPSCHGVQAAGGIRLTPPLADVHAVLLGPTRDPQAPQDNIVVPGDPERSRLWVIMSERDPTGTGGPMPPNAPVPPCELEAVRQWILDGAPQN